MYLVPFAGISFLWFMGAVRDRLGDKEDKFFATLFLGSGFLFVGMLFVLAALAGGLLELAAEHQGHPPLQVWEFGRPTAYNLLTTCAMRMAGVFAIATSTIALHTGLLLRWLALTGFLVGLLSLFAVGPCPGSNSRSRSGSSQSTSISLPFHDRPARRIVNAIFDTVDPIRSATAMQRLSTRC